MAFARGHAFSFIFFQLNNYLFSWHAFLAFSIIKCIFLIFFSFRGLLLFLLLFAFNFYGLGEARGGCWLMRSFMVSILCFIG
ncbi:unnamed protein product [Meloidogyne enterolobii]|uniref:Uncharacterized protein n=1 Tax=Meloidogyne enterolobii TaxID=390850 RepID=A0ACB0Z3R9_MELEN